MKYKHIFWDWNGTLFNDTELCHRITNTLLAQLGVAALSYDDYRKKLRHPIKEFYDEIMGGDTKDSYTWFSETFHDYYEAERQSCSIHDHALDNLLFFRDKGARQSVLSAHPQYLLDSIIATLNIGHHFDHIVGAADKLASSKFKEGEKLMRAYNAAPETTLIIGDTTHDAEVADRLGIDCIIVAQGMQCKSRLAALRYPVVDTLEELQEIVSSGAERFQAL